MKWMDPKMQNSACMPFRITDAVFLRILFFFSLIIDAKVTGTWSREGHSPAREDAYEWGGVEEHPAALPVGNSKLWALEDEEVVPLECLPHEFPCGQFRCIDRVRLCDTKVDCPDRSDEDPDTCRAHTCPATHFKCHDGFCVPIEHICDYTADCPDGSDEVQCHYRKCWHGEWQCRNQQCINEVFLCDGQSDCKDNSDEFNCTVENFITCDHDKHVHISRKCDGNADCNDQMDETDCGLCRTAQFQCPNGRCIPQAQVCDSVCDCQPSCGDERANCADYYEGLPGLAVCRKRKSIACNKSNRCIRQEFICDGSDDCQDGGTDEFQCHTSPSASVTFSNLSTVTTGFRCSDGRYLPVHTKCDLQRHCLLGEDERVCRLSPCSANQSTCLSGECIDSALLCNGVPDCRDNSDELNCLEYECPPDKFKCATSGQCVNQAKVCDFNIDCTLDSSDEPDNCTYKHTPCDILEFRCDNGQCISSEYRCRVSVDSLKHGCLDESHIKDCGGVQCDGVQWLKCRNGPCYHVSLQCNGLPDCYKASRTWTDEEGCPFQCASAAKCVCMDVTMECRDTGLTALPEYVEPSITKYRLSGNRLNHTLSVRSFEGLHRLTLLDLSANDIMELPNGRPFATLWQLRVLVLRKNGISRLRKELFYGLANVRVLDLAENYIEIVEERAFTGLSSLPQLDLSRQLISHLPAASFLGLRSLLSLNLSGNPLQYFDVDTFLGLPQLVTLDLSSSVHWNAVRFTGEAFRHLPALTHLYTSDARLCCSIGGKVPHCYPKLDHFSSCSDLMSNRILRTSIWLMGTIAVVANAVVIVWRLPGVRRSRIHAFLIINLAVGDIIMGVYLLIIAGADLHYRGTYIFYYDVWKSSGWCKAAGVFSTVSSELSIFTLLLITLDRLLTILLPFHIDLRLSYASARIAVLLLWISVWTIALIPLLPLPYFQNFYGRSGVCLALHITPDRSPGWEYAVFIFLGLNMLACVLIILSYAGMYGVALRTHRAVEPSPQKSRQEARLARRMVLIVLTSLACYLPLSIMSLLALAGVSMPEEVYSWVAVFMLPVNAALNPLLYTMSTRPFKRHIQTSITDRAAHLRESLLASMSSSSRRRRSSASTTSGSGQAKNKRALSLKREDVLPEE